MDTTKKTAVVTAVQTFNPNLATDQGILDILYADWPEGEAHTAWLEEASVAEIADWVIAGLL